MGMDMTFVARNVLSLVAVVLASMTACTADDEPSQAADVENAAERSQGVVRDLEIPHGLIGTTATTQCGSSCPSGQHAIEKLCTRTCNGGITCTSSSPLNTVVCEANATSFGQCGTTCPSGWHSTSKFCNSQCQNRLSCQGYTLNAAQCTVNTGTFNQCGTLCPSGWVSTSTYCNAQCQGGLPCTGSSAPNAASCRPL